MIVGGLGACATQPITKLVGGRQITTRSIDPDAYEHASRAFLLGNFIALLAVQPDCVGQGVGRALMAHIEKATFAHRRWLYVSSDSGNLQATRFYRKLGFKTVARLPGLIRPNRTEILLRKPR